MQHHSGLSYTANSRVQSLRLAAALILCADLQRMMVQLLPAC